ncbi:MAG: hypothetical protein BZ133_04710 [Methanosphaera sp. SHI613]|jgi:hypothetical protein|nr:MAG: hypothetical protein BZ133_04710 [Methanosphaera sp. SHI613]
MYDDTGGSNPKRLLIILLVALIVVIGGTILLNGQTSTEFEDNTTDENVTNETPEVNPINSTVLGNTTWGTVTKMGPYGNASSDTKIAYVLGVNQNSVSNNSIVPSLESQNELKYAYYIYLIDVSNSQNNNDNTNSSSNMSVNDKSQLLAKEFATPDIINNKYDCCVDIHSTNDSNSYVFVASDNTVTSKNLIDHISNTTGIGSYTPEGVTYTESVSMPILENNIPSIVYVTREFYSNGISNEVTGIISAIDNFVFDVSSNSNNTNSQSSNVVDDSSTSTSNDTNETNITNPTMSGSNVNSEVD